MPNSKLWPHLFTLTLCSALVVPKPGLTATIPLPPSIILPNYDRAMIGQIPGLEAGAFTARSSGPAANWYNQAGLAQSRRTEINTSSSAYGLTSVSTDVGGTNIGSTTGADVPGFFGLVIAEPILSNDRVRAGFSLTRELTWAPALQTQITSSPSTGASERSSYSIQEDFSQYVPSFSVAYAPNTRQRYGTALSFSNITYQGDNTTSDQLLTTSTQSNLIQTARIGASAVDMLLSASAQVELSERWRLGLLLRSPGLRLWGSAKLTAESLSSSGGQTSDTSFYDASAMFRYSIPFQAALGVAYVAPSFEIEGDLRYHAPLDNEVIFSSGNSITTATNTGAAPTISNQPLSDIINNFRHVLNFSLGGAYRLSSIADLHFGFYTSYSPVRDITNPVFRKIDLYGATFGPSINLHRFSASAGVAYEWGKSDPYAIINTFSGAPLQATVHASTLRILYALSFSF